MINIFAQRGNRRFMALMACESLVITGAVALSAYLFVREPARTLFESQAVLGKGLLIAEVNGLPARDHVVAPFLVEAGFTPGAMGLARARPRR